MSDTVALASALATRFAKIAAKTVDDFDVSVTLGTGSFGRVRFVTHKETNTHWAIKILKKFEVIRLQQVSPPRHLNSKARSLFQKNETIEPPDSPPLDDRESNCVCVRALVRARV